MSGFLKKKGKYYFAVINYKDAEGKWRKKWVNTNTGNERVAKKMLNDIIKEEEQKMAERPVPSNSMKFHELMKYWFDNVIINHVCENTYEGYRTNIDVHIIPYFKKLNIDVQELKAIDIDAYINHKLKCGRVDGKGGLSANYMKKQYNNMNMALEYAIDILGIIEYNPITKVKLPKIKKYIPTFYTSKELDKLLKITKGTIIESAVFLTVYYGFRRGEVLGLRWKDINFHENCLTVKNNRTPRIEKERLKTDASLRTLPLIDDVRVYLKSLKRQQADDRKFFGKAYINNDYICKYPDGSPVNLYTIDHKFSRVLKEHNMEHIRFHDLRHSTGSYLMKLGVAMTEIGEWLGHADPASTFIYLHTDAESKRTTAKKIQKYFTLYGKKPNKDSDDNDNDKNSKDNDFES
jgi:integrase